MGKITKIINTADKASFATKAVDKLSATKTGRKVKAKGEEAYYAALEKHDIGREEAQAFAQNAAKTTRKAINGLDKTASALKLAIGSVVLALTGIAALLVPLITKLIVKLFPAAETGTAGAWVYVTLGVVALCCVIVIAAQWVKLRE